MGQSGASFRLSGSLIKLHSRFLRSTPTFLDVTRQTRTNDILPSGQTAPTARHHMVEAQEMGRQLMPAVLTPILVSQENIATIKFD